MHLPVLTPVERFAFFFDFDGTLVSIAERPGDVHLDGKTRRALERLFELTDGATAIITGRDIASVDAFLSPLQLPAAGVHGLTRRDNAGTVHAPKIDLQLNERLVHHLAGLLKRHPELLMETKYGAVALHYRANPELAPECIAAMEEAVADVPGYEIRRGKMVVEAKTLIGNKGSAVAEFMNETPFRGRSAVFAGDDITDEDAFAYVNTAGGVSIKIGPGETLARYRADTIDDFLLWLRRLPEEAGGTAEFDQS